MKTLITGGVKSGKSRYALKLARERFPSTIFLATGVPFDEEMEERIAAHRGERDESFVTLEEPVGIDRVEGDNIVFDDITVWLNNLFHHGREEEWRELLERFLAPERNCIIVTNETGWGNIPMDPFTRKFNRFLGAANGLTAERTDEVYLMVAGIPVRIKG
ncbi:MAG: bifunctional adenosylcobinamide kinase/adenosylcobinamide-phosphate guanylyltransferase [bacterium]